MESGCELIARISRQLDKKYFDGSDELLNFESRLIAEKVTGDSFSDLFLNAYSITTRQEDELSKIVSARNTGKPLAYVINSCEFRGLDLFIDERVLIPRSETELVVQEAIDELATLNRSELNVVDIGTGSGAIAYSIANEISNASVYATDISPEAIEVAKLNGSAVGSIASRVFIEMGDLFGGLPKDLKGNVDLVISNPPYIGLDEMQDLDKSVSEFEPHLALFSGEVGEDHYRRIVSEAKDWLKPTSKLILEISPRHIELIQELAKSFGYCNVEIKKDFAGRERIAKLSA